MPLIARLVLASGVGAVAALSFEPYGLGYLLPVAVAGLALLVGAGVRRGFLVGAVFGTTFMLMLLPWLQVIGVDAWLVLSLLEGLFYGLLGAGAAVVARLPWWPVWTASLWVALEALRGSVPFGGFPWGRLAFATVDTPAAGLFAYVGAPGTSLVVALAGTCLAWAVLRLRRTPREAFAAVGVAGLAAVSVTALPQALPAPATEGTRVVEVAAVQGDVPGEGMAAFAERRVVLNNHVTATYELAGRIAAGEVSPDLVVWPESSTDIDPFSDPTVHADIQGAVDAVGVPVLVGAMVAGEEPADVYNQGIVWEPGAGPTQRYSKTHPVPFGEYIPFRDVLAGLFRRLDQIPRDMVAGTEPGLLQMAGVTVGDVICFEVAYDDVVGAVVEGGADLLVVQTNNATYMGTGQIEQQFAISRLRAIETGRHVVVAATNGVTGVIGPTGEVVARAPVRSRTVLVERVALAEQGTPARVGGPLTQTFSALAAVVSVAFALFTQYRRRRPGAPGTRTGDA